MRRGETRRGGEVRVERVRTAILSRNERMFGKLFKTNGLMAPMYGSFCPNSTRLAENITLVN